tara:strand:- start:2490 stop:3065 length:576 start_codon:yes stop_codon:yes gene_type:complete
MIRKYLFSLLILFFSSLANADMNYISEGNKDAKIEIIVYESLTCGHCANFHKDVYPELKEKFIDTGLAKIEFRPFPLDYGALQAAKLSQCRSDNSLNILQALYSNQKKWAKGNTQDELNESLRNFFISEGINIDFEKCINDKKAEDFVINSRINGAKDYEINATPTMIINGKKFEKALNFKNIKNYLEKMI